MTTNEQFQAAEKLHKESEKVRLARIREKRIAEREKELSRKMFRLQNPHGGEF